jgi:hypothetical protein
MVHTQGAPSEVAEAKEVHGPGQGEEQVDEGEWIKGEGAPLRHERRAAVTEGIPEGQFTVPKHGAMEVDERITQDPKVAVKEGVPAQEEFGKGEGEKGGDQSQVTAGAAPQPEAMEPKRGGWAG